ncbi:virion core protein, T7 gp14 family [Algihabitans sp.]|uniref:virion core protein, T7 gp14 family n=1 Tax=Algihabitans sp. TaxID=2821514 RepID=UPI003BABB5FB
MCELGFMIASTAAALGSAAMQMQAQSQQAAAQRASLNYQRQVSENNARTSEALAEDARQRGRAQERAQRMQTRQLLGRQRAVLGATGLQADSGSALDILGDTAALGELDALQIRDNATREAWRFRVQASNDQAQADLFGLEASHVQGASPAPLLSALGTVSDRWYGYGKDNGWWST